MCQKIITVLFENKVVPLDMEESATKQLQKLPLDDNAKFSLTLLKPFATGHATLGFNWKSILHT